MKYTYNNVKFNSHTEVNFTLEDQKFIKQMASWGKGNKVKDKRPDMIQHCYATILNKGVESIPKMPNEGFLKEEHLQSLKNWLNLRGNPCISAYLEPLRIATIIYLDIKN